jgi:hypothetical protein
MSWEEQEAWAKQKRSIDNWRKDVAYSAQPIVVPTRDASFRRGVPAPIEVSVDDGQSFKSGPRSVSVRAYQTRAEEPRVIRRRTLIRRPSSDHGGYSRRRPEARSPSRTRTIVERITPSRRSSSHHHQRVVREVERDDPPPRRSSRAPTRPPPSSFLNTFLPSTRSTRSRTVTYDRAPSYERSSYDKPRTRDLSPRYRTARDPEPEAIRYKVRPKSVYTSQPQPATGSRKSKRSGSVDIDDRMRLLSVRDRFREEVERARDWRGVRPEPPQRYREYDRRSMR